MTQQENSSSATRGESVAPTVESSGSAPELSDDELFGLEDLFDQYDELIERTPSPRRSAVVHGEHLAKVLALRDAIEARAIRDIKARIADAVWKAYRDGYLVAAEHPEWLRGLSVTFLTAQAENYARLYTDLRYEKASA